VSSRISGGAIALAPDWQPHTQDQNQAIIDQLELTGEFWRLA
jgi:hypothetical protein